MKLTDLNWFSSSDPHTKPVAGLFFLEKTNKEGFNGIYGTWKKGMSVFQDFIWSSSESVAGNKVKLTFVFEDEDGETEVTLEFKYRFEDVKGKPYKSLLYLTFEDDDIGPFYGFKKCGSKDVEFNF